MAVGDLIRAAESGGNNYAKNPRSSATGPDQFIASTWLETIRTARPDLVQGKSDAELLALRTDPEISGQVRDTYTAQNRAILSQNGHPVTPGTDYLAHFAGPKGAVSVLGADPGTPAASIMGPAAVKANPFLAKMTVGDLRAWADRKMGGGLGAPAAPAGPSIAIPVQPGPALVLAPQAPQQAAPQQQAQQQAPPQFDVPQMPPIFMPPRRAIDLSRLKATFKAPSFSRG